MLPNEQLDFAFSSTQRLGNGVDTLLEAATHIVDLCNCSKRLGMYTIALEALVLDLNFTALIDAQ